MTLRSTPTKAREWQQRSRKPLKRTAMKRSRKPLPPVSQKKMTWNEEYYKARQEALEEAEGLCQAKLYGCTVIATEAHHKAGKVGKDANKQLLAACRHCHNLITEHKVNDYDLGLSIRRGRST